MAFGNHNRLSLPAASAESAGHAQPVFGIVTALPEEFAAASVLLDDARSPSTIAGDRAQYVLGTMPSRDEQRPHEVVLTLGDTGNTAAAESCANLIRSFPSVDTVIMCGIACGVPVPDRPERHVKLGDIAVATWGIADYDHVIERDDGRQPRQPFPLPSPLLVRLARYLEAVEIRGDRPWEPHIDRALTAIPAFARPDPSPAGRPQARHGVIGSADRSLRSARVRDELAAAHQLIAMEMEGKGIGSAGFAGGLEWFVVRGISDYGDADTTRLWRGYASVVAAAYVRALLAECQPLTPRGGHPQATGCLT
ncbi:5'-methylthioadenosine/S-adenosylhomocysteine nucleosidase family protein [Couchioplanes azureus]|uniref:5'-methylthioadenosine/S-adenosylhomocysteine nucleosidase family protein n=1 Tax=Couchioplanes caeruleus TaxID=56438 RepID=UPI003671D512